jgi:tetratricopeptide (TPR) repeat protein
MPARSRLLGPLRLLAVLVALGTGFVRAASTASEAVVVLPPFEVRDVRPWRFVEVPGLQILSLATERETERFAQRLQEVQWLTPLLLPPGIDGAVTAPSSLFLRHFAGDQLASKVGAGVGFSTFSFSIFWQDTSLVFPSEAASRDWGAGRDYLNLDFQRVSGLAVPHVPAWYRDGMGDLLRSATISAKGVSFSSRTWKAPPRAAPRAGTLNPFDVEDQPRLPVRELLALRPGADAMKRSLDTWQSYLRSATLLVHWGFFADRGRHRAAFLKFVAEAAEATPDDAMVRDLLGVNLKDLQSLLEEHAFGLPSQQIPAPARLPSSAPVLVREASRAEVARILGEAYLRLSTTVTRDPAARKKYLASAREVLDDAREAGETDPLVFHQLGVLAQENGNDAEAIDWLQRAVDGSVARPAAYVSLAELRLRQLAATDVGALISAADTATIWGLLQKADALRPRLPTTYSLGLAMWQNSRVRPGMPDLLLLAEGVDAFPDEPVLRRDALRLINKLGVNGHPTLENYLVRWRLQAGVPGF